MDAIRNQLKNPIVVGVLALVIGFLLGWLVMGWLVWPVEYYDAEFTDLRADLKTDYLRTAVDAYAGNPSVPQAQKAFAALGKDGAALIAAAEKDTSFDQNRLAAFKSAVQAPVVVAPGVTPTTTPGKTGTSPLTSLLIGMCVATLVLAALIIGFFWWRSRKAGPKALEDMTPAQQASEAAKQAPMTDYAALGEEPPMAQFMASYKLGDDLFDDSFSIDSPAGEFLGECGVGISDTIGVGDPKKVSAFEIWLFDKNDIQTVTKVLMSTHSFGDDATKQRLAAKGEPVQAKPGEQVVLETATLQLVGRVVDMSYGEGALPAESFFDEVILEIAIWQK
jgi:uncharacterized membrane protein YciS (DUF1049 family)